VGGVARRFPESSERRKAVGCGWVAHEARWIGHGGWCGAYRTATRGRGAGNGESASSRNRPVSVERRLTISERVSSRTRVGGGRGSDDRMGASPMPDGRADCGCSLTTRWLQTEARGIFSERSVARREARDGKRGAGSGSGLITVTRRDCTLLLERVLELQRHGRPGRTAQPPHREVESDL